MSIVYNKLVRDKIPEIIRADNKKAITRILGDNEYQEELLAKLQEELDELREDLCVEELADVIEVIIALKDSMGIDEEMLEDVRKKKAEKNGAFNERIYLESVED